METISEHVRRRMWRWIERHVLWMENNDISRVALRWAPEGKYKSGRPREMRRRTVEKERMAMGYCSSRVFLGRGSVLKK